MLFKIRSQFLVCFVNEIGVGIKIRNKIFDNFIKDEINQMKLKMVPLLDKLSILESELADSKLKTNEFDQPNLLKEENSKLKLENGQLKEELAKRDSIFQEWNETIDQLDEKMNSLEKENKVLKTEKEELDKLKKENKLIKSENDKIKIELNTIKKKFIECKKEFDHELDSKNDMLKNLQEEVQLYIYNYLIIKIE